MLKSLLDLIDTEEIGEFLRNLILAGGETAAIVIKDDAGK